MTRKHKHSQARRATIAWPIIVFGVVLVAGAAFLFSRQGSAAGGGSSAGGAPQIAVDQPKIDYGYVKFGETRQFKIAVTNKGSGPLRFKAKPYVEVLEGC